jgi:hypothetical protein
VGTTHEFCRVVRQALGLLSPLGSAQPLHSNQVVESVVLEAEMVAYSNTTQRIDGAFSLAKKLQTFI